MQVYAWYGKLTLQLFLSRCDPHVRDACLQTSVWPCMHPKIPIFARCPASINCSRWSSWCLTYFLWIALNSCVLLRSMKVANLPWFCTRSATVLPGPPVHPILSLTRRRFLLTERVVWRVQSPFSTLMPRFSISLCIPNCRCESPSVIRVFTPSADSLSCNNCLARSFPSSCSALPMAWSGGKFNLQLGLCCFS